MNKPKQEGLSKTTRHDYEEHTYWIGDKEEQGRRCKNCGEEDWFDYKECRKTLYP